MMLGWTVASAVCAAVPAVMTVWNLTEYVPPPAAAAGLPAVAVVIPARNEADGIAACVESVLRSEGVAVSVVVVDDGSTDGTAEIVAALAARDARVRLVSAGALPEGWNGKQHACWVGATAVDDALVCFLDADVRLKPGAVARMATLLVRERAALVSGFPRELTGTWLEKLLIPLIHFVLLGFLPMRALRTSTKPGFAAGCGQFLMVERAAYMASGGHTAIKETMHDGLRLPRLFRERGYATRLADLTDLAECRMYRTAAGVWNGLAKNATEGMAAPARIWFFTAVLLLGQVLPLVLLWVAWSKTFFVVPFLGPPVRVGMDSVWWALAAVCLSCFVRAIDAIRFRQSWVGVVLHPVSVLVLLVLQWWALGRRVLGLKASWKGRLG